MNLSEYLYVVLRIFSGVSTKENIYHLYIIYFIIYLYIYISIYIIMCFNAPVSLATFFLGFIFSLILIFYGNPNIKKKILYLE